MKTDTLLRALRVLLGTVTVVALLGAGGAVAATKFAQADLEDRAVESARKLAESTLAPVLQPRDAKKPLHGTRYDSLLSIVRREVLDGPISGITLWRGDGTILFADERELVGRRHADMEETIGSIGRAPAVGEVEGDRFLTLVPIELGEDGTSVTAELARSHATIVAQAKARWWGWAGTAGRIAAVAFALYLLSVGSSSLLARRRASRTSRARERDRAVARPQPQTSAAPKKPSLLARLLPSKPSGADDDEASLREQLAAAAPAPAGPAKPSEEAPAKQPAAGNGASSTPSYMIPGFREVEEARRKAEEALAESLQERARLENHVRQLEAELAEARKRLSMADAQ